MAGARTATVLNIFSILLQAGRKHFRGCLLLCCVVGSIFLVFKFPVQNKLRRHFCQQAINQSSDLPSGDHLWIDEVAVQVKDQIDNHSRVHTLLNVAGQRYFIDTKLVRHACKLIFKTELRRLVFYS